jgi:hypothetical protein
MRTRVEIWDVNTPPSSRARRVEPDHGIAFREDTVPMSVGCVEEAGPEKRMAEEETSSVRRERVVHVLR